MLQYQFISCLSKLCNTINCIYKISDKLFIKTIKNELYSIGIEYSFTQQWYKLDETDLYKIKRINMDFVYDDNININNIDLTISNSYYHTIIADNTNNIIYSQSAKYSDKYQRLLCIHSSLQKLIYNTNNTNNINVIKISCQSDYALFLLNNGNVKISKIENDILKSSDLIIKKSKFFKVLDISSGYKHSLFLDSNNNILVFGDNNYEQLGINKYNKYLSYYKSSMISKFFINKNILKIICSHNNSAVICKNGNCYLFGSNEYGQIGNGKITKSSSPYLLSGMNIIHVSISCDHIVLLTSDNQVYGIGNNTNYQFSDKLEGKCNDDIIWEFNADNQGYLGIRVKAGINNNGMYVGKGTIQKIPLNSKIISINDYELENYDFNLAVSYVKSIIAPITIKFRPPINTNYDEDYVTKPRLISYNKIGIKNKYEKVVNIITYYNSTLIITAI